MAEQPSMEIARNVRLTGDMKERSERQLHASDGANLPALCIDCGAPVRSGSPDIRTYRGFAPGAWWLFLFKAGTRALVVRLFGRTARVGVYVCDDHESTRRTKRLVGLVMLLLALPVFLGLVAAKMSSGVSVAIFFIWTIAGIIIRSGGTDLLDVRGVTADKVAVFASPKDEFVEAAMKQPAQPQQPAQQQPRRPAAPAAARPAAAPRAR